MKAREEFDKKEFFFKFLPNIRISGGGRLIRKQVDHNYSIRYCGSSGWTNLFVISKPRV